MLWRAHSESLGSALVMVPAEDEPSPRVLSRFRHEHALKDRLEADWAVRPTILVERGGTVEMLLEDPGGMPLDGILGDAAQAGRGMDIPDFLVLAPRIAESLSRLHSRNIVHKDLRPANILVSPDGQPVRFTGFGIASLLPRHHIALDPIETIEGNLVYMAPEQTGRMNRSVDCRSDLYSLGIVFFEMLAGRPPFASEDPVELVHFHVARRPPLLSGIRDDIPGPVSEIIMKLLAKPAEERYQTASGLAADLLHCLDSWRGNKAVAPFRLAANDTPDRLIIPEKLYGRAAELHRLQKAAERVTAQGSLNIVLVTGYSGIGKSALVGELHKALIQPRALFASGKFDQYRRHIPYATWAQAFQGTIRQVLGQGDAQLEEWRQAIQDALGQNGRLITDLIPELALLIGEQPPVSDLPPNEAQVRFFATFRRFLSTWATAEHPLVLFLDDLQWIDPGSLKLFEYLATHSELRHLLLICSYRDNEVGPAHPLALALDSIRSRVSLDEILLQPLSTDHLNQMVAETLFCPRTKAQPLAEIIGAKTAGNPFFTIQFMQGLFEDGLLAPGPDGWQWDMERIAGKTFTDNVVDLMVGKLRRLPEGAQSVMRTLACLGNTVSVNTLHILFGDSAAPLDDALDEALRASYLVRRKDSIRFTHDRIQEAAYFLLPPESRPAEHLRIGRMLLSGLDDGALDDQIFDVVNHFNIGAELVADPEERQRIRLMNVRAGEKAKASAAYATARTFFVEAMEMLPPSAWEEDYQGTFRLHLERTTCELLLGNFQQVDQLFPLILDKARSNADRARAYRLLILRNQVAGQYGEAVEVALTALRLFGLTCPTTPADIEAAVERARQDSTVNLKGREISELIDAPVMTDPDALGMLGILADAMPCAWIARPDLYAWLALNALNVTLLLGNDGDSCAVYMGYAIVLVSKYDAIDESIQYANVALKLQEALSRPDLRGRILVRAGVFINSRRNPMRSSIDILREGFVDCQAAGDYSYAVYGALEISWLTFECGAPLDDISAAAMTYSAFAQQSRNNGLLHTLRAQEAFVSCLTGEAELPTFMERGETSLAALTAAKFGTGIAYYHLMVQTAALLHGDYQLALEQSRHILPYLKSITGWVAETSYHLLAVLTLTALDAPSDPAEAAERRAELAAHVDLLARRTANCPENYGCRHDLALAEIARTEGDLLEAERLYENAISQAHDNATLHIEAIAYELASRFYRGRDRQLIADTYLRKARDAYARWGAMGKVRQLEAAYPQLADKPARSGAGNAPHGQFQSLDAISVVKASQAVSGEIALNRLVETLLRIAVENAGAGRGVLVVDLGGTSTVVADARIDDGAVVVVSLRSEPTPKVLPMKVLNYVQRAWKGVLLDDAPLDSDFGTDEYIQRNNVRSVMCLPMVKQSKLIGLLYLENSQVSHVFTAARVAVLELLASQAAISLENSLLYEDLERHRDDLERTVALRTAELSEKKEQLDKILAEQDIILENASLGIVVVQPAPDGRRLIRRANRAIERLFGFSPDELLGMDTRDVWGSDEEFRSVGNAYQMLAAGETYSGEHVITRRNGQKGFCKLVGTAIEPADLAKGTVWLIEDITDRHAAEVALKAAKQMAEEMAEAFRYKSDQVSALLDNSGQGFLSFQGDLLVKPEFSHPCLAFFGGSPAGKPIDELLFSGDDHARDTLRACIEEALAEKDTARAELYLSLLPEEITIGSRILKAEFKPLDQAIMVVLTDITSEKALAAQVARERTHLEMIVSAVTYGNDFFDAVAEFTSFVQDGPGMWRGRDRTVLYRMIHTFKGTFNQLGFHHLPAALHEVESSLQRLGSWADGAAAAAMVFSRDWQAILASDLETVRSALGDDFMARRGVVTVTPEQAKRFERFARGLLDEAEVPDVLEEIAAIRTVSLRQAIADFDKMIHQISARLEKEVAPLVVEGDDVRIDPEVFGPFLRSLGHVFRNAVDHGIEDPDSRLSTGKSEVGTITCAIRRADGALSIDIADDGSGIDVETLRRRAAELTSADVSGWGLADLVFADGVSVRTEATELSGRGVGMTAVKASVEELGGSVSINSRPGHGTLFQFHIPFPPQVEGRAQ
ncbi:AAA family ATPase [Magnetospirillum sp. ME-1]|uniref:AAA family ATPase n=1 Tax=Magnetospirillum sp. ME-1 TaxID=1639348 RepID=UPI001981EC96|nr:AAA family ATPase [Magnetospirillum sp. ME-1]